MPSQKKKKNAKSNAKPAPVMVSVKSEPLDIKPLSAYADDRVELIRQAFMCLKPKEVKALVPEFMSGKSIETIQEQCLDEVLGISTKRLLSVINSTKCPTDTESDGSEDEAQVHTEHISLDEISSDSEVEISNPVKTIKTKEAKKKNKDKDSKVNETANKNGNKKNEKEMTVLEILELQARARAIRSQLALEPVTKIELDSDQENTSGTETEAKKNLKSSKTDNKNTEASTSSQLAPTIEQPKRVRLKRNFRIRQVGDEDPPVKIIPEQPADIQKPSDGKRKSRSKSREKQIEPKPVQPADPPTENESKVDKPKSRDSSPEVIPVIPSPETLLISSDSEEEKAKGKKSSIFVENVEELDKQRQNTKLDQAQKKISKPVENEEPEEGEISADDNPISATQGTLNDTSPETVRQSTKSNDDILKTPLEQMEEELDYEIKEVSDSEPESNAQGNDSSKTLEDANQSTQEIVNTTSSADEKCDESENDSSNSSSETEQDDDCSREEEDDPDIVEIHDSSDETILEQKMAEDGPEKSWNSRWLESHKVAKVMAASRLGNKVRDKLKKNKKKEQEKHKQLDNPLPEPEVPPTVSNVVVGSVEHYNELLNASTDDRAPVEASVKPSDNE
ncbi:glutamic acid-rich protein [Sabethes cyaneus]|uniref:glutamic acid-rich protein n=1 Tax=Sabethes cyaneus TaxID=53552 RepID=UPI00237D737A|nr:glutamic acid-rich protein [Sabethes cyaneus]